MTENDQIRQLKARLEDTLYLETLMRRFETRLEKVESQVSSLRGRLNRMQAGEDDEDTFDREEYRVRTPITPPQTLDLSQLPAGYELFPDEKDDLDES